MVNFNMKDTIGRGIRKVFTEQKKRKIGNFLSMTVSAIRYHYSA